MNKSAPHNPTVREVLDGLLVARRAMFQAFGECITKDLTPTEIADRLLAAAPSPAAQPTIARTIAEWDALPYAKHPPVAAQPVARVGEQSAKLEFDDYVRRCAANGKTPMKFSTFKSFGFTSGDVAALNTEQGQPSAKGGDVDAGGAACGG